MLPLAKLAAAASWRIYEDPIRCTGVPDSCYWTCECFRECELPQLDDPTGEFEMDYFQLPDPKIGKAIAIPTDVVAVAYTNSSDVEYAILAGTGGC